MDKKKRTLEHLRKKKQNFFTECTNLLLATLGTTSLDTAALHSIASGPTQTISILLPVHPEPSFVAQFAVSVPLVASQHRVAVWHSFSASVIASQPSATSAQLPAGSSGNTAQSCWS